MYTPHHINKRERKKNQFEKGDNSLKNVCGISFLISMILNFCSELSFSLKKVPPVIKVVLWVQFSKSETITVNQKDKMCTSFLSSHNIPISSLPNHSQLPLPSLVALMYYNMANGALNTIILHLLGCLLELTDENAAMLLQIMTH